MSLEDRTYLQFTICQEPLCKCQKLEGFCIFFYLFLLFSETMVAGPRGYDHSFDSSSFSLFLFLFLFFLFLLFYFLRYNTLEPQIYTNLGFQLQDCYRLNLTQINQNSARNSNRNRDFQFQGRLCHFQCWLWGPCGPPDG